MAFCTVSLGVYECSMHGKRGAPCYFQPSRAGQTEIPSPLLSMYTTPSSDSRRQLDHLTAFWRVDSGQPFPLPGLASEIPYISTFSFSPLSLGLKTPPTPKIYESPESRGPAQRKRSQKELILTDTLGAKIRLYHIMPL